MKRIAVLISGGDVRYMNGMQEAEITATPLSEIAGKEKPLRAELFHLARSLAK
jgi:hypothetical protein